MAFVEHIQDTRYNIPITKLHKNTCLFVVHSYISCSRAKYSTLIAEVTTNVVVECYSYIKSLLLSLSVIVSSISFEKYHKYLIFIQAFIYLNNVNRGLLLQMKLNQIRFYRDIVMQIFCNRISCYKILDFGTEEIMLALIDALMNPR